MKYAFVFHLPGAAGNFFTRCLNLLDNAYAWIDKRTSRIPHTLEDKLELLGYHDIDHTDWVKWEFKLATCYNPGQRVAMPAGAELIAWKFHPDYKFLDNPQVGPADQVVPLYIDAQDEFEWCILNALYKHSSLKVEWFEQGQQMRNDPAVLNISLREIITSEHTFIAEFRRVCEYLGHNLLDHERIAVLTLYRQWATTTLHPEQFADFKQRVGFNL